MQPIELLLVLIIVLLAGLGSFLLFYYFKINKAISLFLENGKVKDVKDLLYEQIEKSKELEMTLTQANNKITQLEDVSRVSFQKIGVVRFNPFADMGGNQSFAIALLDQGNNGFVISSLFVKEGNRVYAKAIANGVSEYTLSAEEKDALNQAMKIHAKKA